MKTFPLAFAAVLLASLPAFSGNPNTGTVAPCFASNTPDLVQKVNQIIIPKIDFRNVTVEEAIAFLRQKAKQLDPDGTGVNIVLKIPAAEVPVPNGKK
jgi:hypothetical protein